MKHRARRRQKMRPRTQAASPAPPSDLSTTPAAPSRLRARVLLVVTAVALCALGSWIGYSLMSGGSAPEQQKPAGPRPGEVAAAQTSRVHKTEDPPSTGVGPKTVPKTAPGASFLEAFGDKGTEAADDKQRPLHSSDDLQKRFLTLAADKEQGEDAVQQQFKAALKKTSPEEVRQAKAAADALAAKLNKTLASFEKDLKRAREARPEDPVLQWLTGELLMVVGGEPEAILPYLRQARKAGLEQPRLLASLAFVLVKTNHFAEAYDPAARALASGAQDPYLWRQFVRAAFALEKFATVVERVEQIFPDQRPAWAAKMRLDAMLMEARWQAEKRLRAAEQKADDLPRVRLVIEHRRFARDANGSATTRIESTGTGEVILELFEDQAPNTVANFLQLASDKVYDGTRFYRAEGAAIVAGGDPKSKTGDAAGDGSGGPGYVIPDEFQRPEARAHFRGCISMVNTGPGTAGSQFFITLVPMPSMDGHFTVFGRVLQGQDVVDRITRGRTNPEVGFYGRLIPGDLLIRAEVLRKRPHEYKVLKEQPAAP
jgi:cyclophilin family peptidyl-prolyl cis-trans isomerase